MPKLWLRIILQRQQQSISAHSGGFFRLMQAVRGHPPAGGVIKGIRTLLKRGAEGDAGLLPFAVPHQRLARGCSTAADGRQRL